MIRINPDVLDKAKQLTGATSDEQLGQAFLNITGSTVRNYRRGLSAPSVVTLMRLKQITGHPLESMLIDTEETAAA